jgi:hypothetical protein
MDSWLRIGSRGGLLWRAEECLQKILYLSSTVQRSLYAPMNELPWILRMSLSVLKKSALCPNGVFMGFMWYQTALICLYIISWLVFVIYKECVFWEVWTERLKYYSVEWSDTVWKRWVEYFISSFSRKNVGSCEAVLSWRHSIVLLLLS